jgi:hypothetical protein
MGMTRHVNYGKGYSLYSEQTLLNYKLPSMPCNRESGAVSRKRSLSFSVTADLSP